MNPYRIALFFALCCVVATPHAAAQSNSSAGTAPVRFTEVQGTGHLYQPGAADLIWNRFFSQIVSGSGACAPCTADLDGSGTVDGADLGGLLSAWGPCSSCPADLDGNGTVDGADLGKLLPSWGTCP